MHVDSWLTFLFHGALPVHSGGTSSVEPCWADEIAAMGPRRTQLRERGARGQGRNAEEEGGARGRDQTASNRTDLATGSGALELEGVGPIRDHFATEG